LPWLVYGKVYGKYVSAAGGVFASFPNRTCTTKSNSKGTHLLSSHILVWHRNITTSSSSSDSYSESSSDSLLRSWEYFSFHCLLVLVSLTIKLSPFFCSLHSCLGTRIKYLKSAAAPITAGIVVVDFISFDSHVESTEWQ